MYASILKGFTILGLLIHGLKLFSVLILSGCPFALLPILVGWRCNYLDFSLQVVKFSTKFCSSNSGVGNALKAGNYSTLLQTPQCSVYNFQLDPWWITGFTDGEGCFSINILRNKTCKSGWMIVLCFSISLHKKDNILLVKIKNYFGVGKISTKHGAQTNRYYVQSIKDIAIIINHFDKYPLKTQKRADFELLKQVFKLIQTKEHLIEHGFYKILAIKASNNKGLSSELKAVFPDIIPVKRPNVEEILIFNIY